MKTEEMIELRHLRYFIAVADELNFDRAAERLQMERSTLTQSVRDAERFLGVRLFDSNARGISVTRAGAAFLDHARRVIALMGQASASARSAALGHSNQVRIGVSDCMAYCRITEILGRYRALNTEALVSLHEMPLHQQISHIRDGLLDASISLDGSHREGISKSPIASDAIRAVIPAVHPLAQAEILSTTDLAHYPLILFSDETDLGAGSLIERFVETFERPHVAFRARSLGTMLTLVALGHGIGLLGSTQMTCVRRRDVVLRPIRGPTPPVMTYVLHSACGLSERLTVLIELARELLSGDSKSDIS